MQCVLTQNSFTLGRLQGHGLQRLWQRSGRGVEGRGNCEVDCRVRGHKPAKTVVCHRLLCSEALVKLGGVAALSDLQRNFTLKAALCLESSQQHSTQSILAQHDEDAAALRVSSRKCDCRTFRHTRHHERPLRPIGHGWPPRGGVGDGGKGGNLLRHLVQGIGSGDSSHDLGPSPVQDQQLPNRHHQPQHPLQYCLPQLPLISLPHQSHPCIKCRPHCNAWHFSCWQAWP